MATFSGWRESERVERSPVVRSRTGAKRRARRLVVDGGSSWRGAARRGDSRPTESRRPVGRVATSRRDATPRERRHKGRRRRRGTPLASTSFIVGRERQARETERDSAPEESFARRIGMAVVDGDGRS